MSARRLPVEPPRQDGRPRRRGRPRDPDHRLRADGDAAVPRAARSAGFPINELAMAALVGLCLFATRARWSQASRRHVVIVLAALLALLVYSGMANHVDWTRRVGHVAILAGLIWAVRHRSPLAAVGGARAGRRPRSPSIALAAGRHRWRHLPRDGSPATSATPTPAPTSSRSSACSRSSSAMTGGRCAWPSPCPIVGRPRADLLPHRTAGRRLRRRLGPARASARSRRRRGDGSRAGVDRRQHPREPARPSDRSPTAPAATRCANGSSPRSGSRSPTRRGTATGPAPRTVNIRDLEFFFHNSYLATRQEGGWGALILVLVLARLRVPLAVAAARAQATCTAAGCTGRHHACTAVMAITLGEVLLDTPMASPSDSPSGRRCGRAPRHHPMAERVHLAANNPDLGGGEQMLLRHAEALARPRTPRRRSWLPTPPRRCSTRCGPRSGRGRDPCRRPPRLPHAAAFVGPAPSAPACSGATDSCPAFATAGRAAPDRAPPPGAAEQAPSSSRWAWHVAAREAVLVPSVDACAIACPVHARTPTGLPTPLIWGSTRSDMSANVGFLGRLSTDKGVDCPGARVWRTCRERRDSCWPATRATCPRATSAAVDEAVGRLGARAERLGPRTPGRSSSPACDLVVFPSVWAEPFGLVVAEAMAAGVPFVISDAGALPEVAGADHPWVARGGDADDLARVDRSGPRCLAGAERARP